MLNGMNVSVGFDGGRALEDVGTYVTGGDDVSLVASKLDAVLYPGKRAADRAAG
jgi:hypothetical protein